MNCVQYFEHGATRKVGGKQGSVALFSRAHSPFDITHNNLFIPLFERLKPAYMNLSFQIASG